MWRIVPSQLESSFENVLSVRILDELKAHAVGVGADQPPSAQARMLERHARMLQLGAPMFDEPRRRRVDIFDPDRKMREPEPVHRGRGRLAFVAGRDIVEELQRHMIAPDDDRTQIQWIRNVQDPSNSRR